MYKEVFMKLPVIINDCYGDPFLPSQIGNTIDKLKDLKGHSGPIGIVTKMVFDNITLEAIKPYLYKNVVIFYSFTGLNEGGFSFSDREKTFGALCNVHNNIVLVIRPIIKGRNDDMLLLKKIIDVAKRFNRPVVYEGGYKKPGSRTKVLDSALKSFLDEYCSEKEVTTYPKTSCATSAILGGYCAAHVDGKPRNLPILEFLGYKFTLGTHGKLCIKYGTNGDRNFIRFLTGSQPVFGSFDPNTNVLSISDNYTIHECTSSWYVWSRNLSSCLGCDYCMIPEIHHLKHPILVGVNPDTLGEKCRVENSKA
jgi:hypothetical protein